MSDEKAKLIYNDGKKKKEKNVENQVKHNEMKSFLKEYCNFVPIFLQDFQNCYKIGEISHDKAIGNKNASSESFSP